MEPLPLSTRTPSASSHTACAPPRHSLNQSITASGLLHVLRRTGTRLITTVAMAQSSASAAWWRTRDGVPGGAVNAAQTVAGDRTIASGAVTRPLLRFGLAGTAQPHAGLVPLDRLR